LTEFIEEGRRKEEVFYGSDFGNVVSLSRYSSQPWFDFLMCTVVWVVEKNLLVYNHEIYDVADI
jgi:hypothetical protein